MFSFSSQLDGGSGGLTQSQSSQNPDPAVTKNRSATGTLPLTVKQIDDAFRSSDDKSNFVVDGVDATNIMLVGLVSNKVERATDIRFTLDDGTGRMDFIRWVNDASDASETAVIQNGMYVFIAGSLKGFQEKKRATAFAIRPVVDYNRIVLHFIECIRMHVVNTKSKGSTPSSTLTDSVSLSDGSKVHQPVQISGSNGTGGSETDIYKLVLNVFNEPASLASEHGLHVDEVATRLGMPINKIKEAIDYHIDVGHIYSTIDDYHFKSACVD